MAVHSRITADWQDGINLLLGAVLFFSPWFMGYEGHQAAAWNAHLVGAVIALMALMALYSFHTWEEWTTGALGVWLLVAPYVLGFNLMTAATSLSVAIGFAVIIMAIWSAYEHGDVAT